MKQNRGKVTLNTYVMDLEGGWSSNALRCLEKIPAHSIGRIFLWHITHGGIGSRGNIPGLGKATYNEIRERLVDNGFPDLDMQVFKLGYESTPTTKTALYELLKEWKTALPDERTNLEVALALKQCSGGH